MVQIKATVAFLTPCSCPSLGSLYAWLPSARTQKAAQQLLLNPSFLSLTNFTDKEVQPTRFRLKLKPSWLLWMEMREYKSAGSVQIQLTFKICWECAKKKAKSNERQWNMKTFLFVEDVLCCGWLPQEWVIRFLDIYYRFFFSLLNLKSFDINHKSPGKYKRDVDFKM